MWALYFVVPAIWLALTIVFVRLQPKNVSLWFLSKASGNSKNEIDRINNEDLKTMNKIIMTMLSVSAITTILMAIVVSLAPIKSVFDVIYANIFFIYFGVICLSMVFSKTTKIVGKYFPGSLKKDTYLTAGIAIGMLIGALVGFIVVQNISIGIPFGMFLGVQIGSNIRRRGK